MTSMAIAVGIISTCCTFIILITLLDVWFRWWRRRHFKWSQQTILITGGELINDNAPFSISNLGSNGIGWELTKLAIERECKQVIIVDMTSPNAHLSKVTFLQIDLSKDIPLLFERLYSQNITPTIIINNAGIWNYGKRLGHLSDEEISSIIAINLMAPIKLTKEFLPQMQKRKFGRIVNISSVLGIGGVARMTDYCASKFGIYGFSEALRLELKADNYNDIIVTTVCPFHVTTNMFKGKIRWNFPTILKSLKPYKVANDIMNAISEGREELYLPTFLILWWVVRLVPPLLRDRLHQLFGSDKSIID